MEIYHSNYGHGPNLAKEVRDASVEDNNGAYSNRRGGENECDNGMPLTTKDRVCSIQPIHYGGG